MRRALVVWIVVAVVIALSSVRLSKGEQANPPKPGLIWYVESRP
jgi:hypothetical protein